MGASAGGLRSCSMISGSLLILVGNEFNFFGFVQLQIALVDGFGIEFSNVGNFLLCEQQVPSVNAVASNNNFFMGLNFSV